MEPLRVAIVGLGRIGVTLEDDPLRVKPCSHIGAWTSVKGVRVVAGCDRQRERRDHFVRRWKIPAVYADHRTLLERERPEILSVATWTDSHESIVLDACRCPSVKAILCEKPLAPDSAAGRRMVEACRRRGVLLCVNHERRFEDRYLLCRRLIRRGFLGEFRTVVGHVLTEVPYRQKSFRVDGTSLMHDGTHLFDIIRFLCGEIVHAEGFVHPRHREVITAVLRLENGVNAFVETGGLRRYFSFELDIQGTDGRILIGNTHLRLFRRRRSRFYSGFHDLAEVAVPRYPRKNFFVAEAEAIVRWVRGRWKGPFPSTGEDGLAALRIIEAVFDFARRRSRR